MEKKFGASNPFKKRYFHDAMDYFREDNEDGHTVFLYVSDDMEWGRKNIRDKHKDLYFVGNNNTQVSLSKILSAVCLRASTTP